MPPLSKSANLIAWIAQLVVAALLGMAGVFKLTGAPESRALFATLGAEPWGRYLVGLLELTATVLVLRPAWAFRGGVLALVLMLGAVGSHLTRLGVNYNDDGGQLFLMALTVLVAALVVVGLRRQRG